MWNPRAIRRAKSSLPRNERYCRKEGGLCRSMRAGEVEGPAEMAGITKKPSNKASLAVSLRELNCKRIGRVVLPNF